MQNVADVLGVAAGDPGKAEARRRVADAVGDLDDDALIAAQSAAVNTRQRDAAAKADRFSPILRPGGQPYYPRQMPGMALTDVELLREARRATNDPDPATRRELYALLAGRPGCGKTALVEAAFGDELLTIEGTGETELADIVGSFTPDPAGPGQFMWIPGKLIEAMEQGRPLLIDDATLIPPNVIARLYPAMDGRRQITVTQHLGEVVTARVRNEASEGFFVVMSHNPGAPGAMLAEAMNSRCRLQMAVTTDMNVASALSVPRAFIEIAKELHRLRDDPASELRWAPEMREMITFRDLAELFDPAIACSNLLGQIQDPLDRALVQEQLKTRFGQVEPLAPGASRPLGQ